RNAEPAAKGSGEVRWIGVAELARDLFDREARAAQELDRPLRARFLEQLEKRGLRCGQAPLQGARRDVQLARDLGGRAKAAPFLRQRAPYLGDVAAGRDQFVELALALLLGETLRRCVGLQER